MRIIVLLFASARALAGSPSLEVELAEPATVADLKAALAQLCPELISLMGSSRVAINACYAEEGESIPLGAEVALIPPVSGGASE